MNHLIKIKSPVIVEGKYDKIALENVIDALIIPTNGFAVFKDKEKCEMIRILAEKYGVVVITDSDSAGNMIRAYIKKIVGTSKITNVYIPQIFGKEKRKKHYGKERLLGVEGMTPDILSEALKRSGITGEPMLQKVEKITKTDLFLNGLSGRENSAECRRSFLKEIGLPQNLSPNAMLDILNTIMTKAEFCEVTKRWQNTQGKN